MSKTMAKCHPDRPHQAKGLCHACYQAAWREANPEKRALQLASVAMSTCHPDKRVLARGLCSTCYRRERRKEPEFAENERAFAREWNRTKYANNPEFRRYRKLYRYGITPDDYDSMLAQQGGCCAACGTRPTGDIPLQVDHCHETGAIRGLLCRNCNSALGHARDDIDRLSALIAYLVGS